MNIASAFLKKIKFSFVFCCFFSCKASWPYDGLKKISFKVCKSILPNNFRFKVEKAILNLCIEWIIYLQLSADSDVDDVIAKDFSLEQAANGVVSFYKEGVVIETKGVEDNFIKKVYEDVKTGSIFKIVFSYFMGLDLEKQLEISFQEPSPKKKLINNEQIRSFFDGKNTNIDFSLLETLFCIFFSENVTTESPDQKTILYDVCRTAIEAWKDSFTENDVDKFLDKLFDKVDRSVDKTSKELDQHKKDFFNYGDKLQDSVKQRLVDMSILDESGSGNTLFFSVIKASKNFRFRCLANYEPANHCFHFGASTDFLIFDTEQVVLACFCGGSIDARNIKFLSKIFLNKIIVDILCFDWQGTSFVYNGINILFFPTFFTINEDWKIFFGIRLHHSVGITIGISFDLNNMLKAEYFQKKPN